MITNELNKPLVWRMIRRVPIASVIMYLFLTSYFADSWLNLGPVIVVTFLLTCLAVVIFKSQRAARILNFPIKVYMGRNNRLWLWLVLFAVVSTGMFFATEAREQNSQPVQVTSEYEQRMNEIREQYDNKRQNGVFKTNAELAKEQHQQNPDTWTPMEMRLKCTILLWVLVLLYGPIAISDELAAGFNKVVHRMSERGEMVSKPLFYDAASKVLGVAVPAMAGTAVAGVAGGALTKSYSFWWEVLKEALAEAAIRISPLGRRR